MARAAAHGNLASGPAGCPGSGTAPSRERTRPAARVRRGIGATAATVAVAG